MKKMFLIMVSVMVLVSGCGVASQESLEVDYFGETKTIYVTGDDWCGEGCVVDPETDFMYLLGEDGVFHVEGTEYISEEAQLEVQSAIIGSIVEDWDSYVDSDRESINISCNDEKIEAETLVREAEANGIKELTLFESGDYKITIYRTANLTGVSDADLKELFSAGCGDHGAEFPLKAYDDYLLWGYGSCSGGYAPNKDETGYEDFEMCTEFEKALDTWLDS